MSSGDASPPRGIEVESIAPPPTAGGYRDAPGQVPGFRIRCRRYVNPFTSVGIVLTVAPIAGWAALAWYLETAPQFQHARGMWLFALASVLILGTFAYILSTLVARLVNVRTIEHRDGLLRAWSGPIPSLEELPRIEIPTERIRAIGVARHVVRAAGRRRPTYHTFFLVYARSAKKKGARAERWWLAHRLGDASDASYVAKALHERLGGERKYEEDL